MILIIVQRGKEPRLVSVCGYYMRVITGSLRGKRLEAPEGLETRPTAEVVKEALFSIIQFDLQGTTVLDLFAGSGQLGIEALSRGAEYAVFVDNNSKAQAVIKRNLADTGMIPKAKVVGQDYAGFLKTCMDTFDIAFLDPPYQKGILEAALPLVVEKMSQKGIIICEIQKGEPLAETVGNFYLHKKYRYGKTQLAVFRRQDRETAIF